MPVPLLSNLSDEQLNRYATLIGFWPILGAIADSRHHAMGGVETFFSVQHMIVYSGVMVIGTIFAYLMYRGWTTGDSFFDGLPRGYELAMVSIGLIALGGAGDMFWHTQFGFEQGGLEVGSWSHLILGAGALLLAATPLRRAWYIGVDTRWRDQFPMLTSTGFLLTILSYHIYSIHPFVNTYMPVWAEHAANELAPLAGAAGIVLYAMFFTALLLHLNNRFTIVRGGFTYIFGLNALLMTTPQSLFIFMPVALLTGLVADVLAYRLRPTWDRNVAVRLYAFIVPATFSALYVATVLLTGSTTWNAHELSSILILPGITGVLVSYAIHPSRRDTPPRKADT